MALHDCSFDRFVTDIKTGGKAIICYGAGMLPRYIEPLFIQYGLARYIRLFLDGNREKEGKSISFQNREVKIACPEYLKSIEAEKCVILITAEKYDEILDQISSYIDLNQWECYVYPLLNRSFFRSMIPEPFIYRSKDCIPKTIHYTWFGKGKKSELHSKCIESWKRYCPNYEIVEWNESNYDIYKNSYIKQAYQREKWAYVSDYARMDILYRYGGIYLDTDVELLKNIDALLETEAFLCFGEWPAPNSGAGMGCIKRHPIIKEIMETRESIEFIQEDGGNDARTNSNYEMQVLMRHGFHMDFSYQMKDGMILYPPDVIAPVSITGRDSFLTDRSIGIHYCNNSWRSNNGRVGQYHCSGI